MKILQVENLSKTYGSGPAAVQALRGASFALEKGEFAAVVGQSGSGKSTLLHCIGGLETPTEGTVLIDGQNLYALNEERRTLFRRRQIGFVFQSFHLIAELTVEQNIQFPLLLDGRRPDPAELDALLETLGLADRRTHLPSQLSGGQQQRVSVGRALLTRPAILLADEPTGNLDSKTSAEIVALLKTFHTRYNQTMLLITHDRGLALQADRVLSIEDGRIAKDEVIRP